MNKKQLIFFTIIFLACTANAQQGDPKLTEVWHPVPQVIQPGSQPGSIPSDAISLFTRPEDASNWTSQDGKPFNWTIEKDFMTVKPSSGVIVTKKAFGDCQLHIEWRSPVKVKGEGQGRGNSGIFLMGKYELQVLDSYQNTTYSNGQAGSMYKQGMPMVNATKGPGEWQSYDVVFRAPVFNPDSSLKAPAYITVFHNGVLIQDHFAIWGGTEYIGIPKYVMHKNKEPLVLQDHGDLVSFRNIWIREL